MRLDLFITALIIVLTLAACGVNTTSTTSNTTATIKITDVWARATSAMSGEMDNPSSTDGTMGEATGATQTPDATQSDAMATSAALGTAQQTDPAMSANIGVLYMTIHNTGNTSDRLLKVHSDIASSIELHATEDANGVMQMRPVDGIDVPANGEVTLKPGGIHAMLIGLRQDLKPGEKIPIQLQFEKGGVIDVKADVREQ